MASSVTNPSPSIPHNSIDRLRLRPAKASLASQSSSMVLTGAVKDALVRHYGSLKAVAISLGIDPGQLTRELQTGDFKLEKLERCDDDAKAFIANALYEAFWCKTDPKAQARRVIRETRAKLDELVELLTA